MFAGHLQHFQGVTNLDHLPKMEQIFKFHSKRRRAAMEKKHPKRWLNLPSPLAFPTRKAFLLSVCFCVVFVEHADAPSPSICLFGC